MLDVFCGTASMALACHDYGVEYLGLEISERVILPARARLAAYVLYSQQLGRPAAPMMLGTEPSGPPPEDVIAGVITHPNAALLPINNVPTGTPGDFSLSIYGKQQDDEHSLPLHALNCNCNVEPDTLIVTECDAACRKLFVRPSALKVLVIFHCMPHLCIMLGR